MVVRAGTHYARRGMRAAPGARAGPAREGCGAAGGVQGRGEAQGRRRGARLPGRGVGPRGASHRRAGAQGHGRGSAARARARGRGRREPPPGRGRGAARNVTHHRGGDPSGRRATRHGDAGQAWDAGGKSRPGAGHRGRARPASTHAQGKGRGHAGREEGREREKERGWEIERESSPRGSKSGDNRHQIT
jgi:hypothetical protein